MHRLLMGPLLINGCMRDVQGKHTPVCAFFRPSCVRKTRLTKRERSEFFPVTDVSVLVCGWWCWAS